MLLNIRPSLREEAWQMRIVPFDAKSSHAGVAGTELSVADVTITPQLWVRAPRSSNIDAETAAMRRLGDTMATEPSKTFQVCVDLALELCDADTCGISLRERTEKGEDIFRWIAMAGQLKHHLHGTTPRYFSPCGITVDGDAPLLMKRPELIYKYLDVGPAFHDVLLIPLTEKGGELEGTIWVVAHNPERKFDGEDARVMQRIAVFIATALHLAKLAQEAKAQATRQELLFRQLIIERRISEAALQEREADLRLVLDSATDAVWCIDTAGVTTMCNAVFLRMLGIEREEHAIGKKLHEVIHHSRADGSYYPEQECPICRTAQGAGAAHIDNEVFFRLDGTSFPVEYRVGPIYRDGQLQGAVCTFVDISERKACTGAAEPVAAGVEPSGQEPVRRHEQHDRTQCPLRQHAEGACAQHLWEARRACPRTRTGPSTPERPKRRSGRIHQFGVLAADDSLALRRLARGTQPSRHARPSRGHRRARRHQPCSCSPRACNERCQIWGFFGSRRKRSRWVVLPG
jgi:PAS domain S-box-containing protein